MSVFNCASLVHWLHANVFHLLTVLLYSYFNYSEEDEQAVVKGGGEVRVGRWGGETGKWQGIGGGGVWGGGGRGGVRIN